MATWYDIISTPIVFWLPSHAPQDNGKPNCQQKPEKLSGCKMPQALAAISLWE
jgi:hypothetical protein